MGTKEYPGLWLLEAFRRGGVDTDQLALEHPLEFAGILEDPSALPPRELNILLNTCARLSGDPHLGLHMVDLVDTTMMGVYGYLLAMAPTVERLFHFGVSYYPILYQGGAFGFEVEESVCTLEYRMNGIRGDVRRHIDEWSLGFFAVLLAERIGHGWLPSRTGFTNSPPADLNELHRVFGRHIVFNASRTSFEFDAEILHRRINVANEGFLEILSDQAEVLLRGIQKEDSLADEVRLRVLENLEQGKAKEREIAQSMAMSSSGFKRRLAARGLTFRALREEVIREVAAKALVETNADVNAIATKLGYSQLSAFDRAFRRMTGMSPSMFRRSRAGRLDPQGVAGDPDQASRQ